MAVLGDFANRYQWIWHDFFAFKSGQKGQFLRRDKSRGMKLPALFSNTVDRDGPVTGESDGWRESANVKNLFFLSRFPAERQKHHEPNTTVHRVGQIFWSYDCI